ncbi:MAG: HAMP domain-containing histidine kinase [Bacteroidetes bacterium]|nr:HAMP domain-containing histidine kinase [Bacteroidota bacterium]
MSKIIKLLTSSHPITLTIAFLLIFSSIIYYVDNNLANEKIDARLQHLAIDIEHYMLTELFNRIDKIATDSLVQYCFVDSNYTINMLGVNVIDSGAIVKDCIAGYISVFYGDNAIDTGVNIDLSKMQIGPREGMPLEKQFSINPNAIVVHPHKMITKHKDNDAIASKIIATMYENIDVFHDFNKDAGGRRRKIYLDVNNFGTDVTYIPFIAPAINRSTKMNAIGDVISVSYITVLRYIMLPLDVFMEGLLQYNVDITIHSLWNDKYIYGDAASEYKLLNNPHNQKRQVSLNRGNDCVIVFAPNSNFGKEWTFFPSVYILLVIISILFYITLSVFINHIRKKEKELVRSNADLKVANNTKDKFFSIIAHDLRNSISSLSNVAIVFEEYYNNMTPEEAMQNIKTLVNTSSNTGKMLENLLQWSRVNMDSIKFKPTECKIDDIVNTTFNDVSIQSNSKDIKLIYENNTDGFVHCDADMINIVLRNLVSNAIKFSNKGKRVSVLVDIWLNDRNYVDENYVMVSVKDEGIGINSDEIKELFKIDNKVTKTGTAGETGTGLGLILCKELIDRHNCRIWVESEENKGTEFKFTLSKCQS